MRRFDYTAPETLEDAIEALRSREGAMLLAGGTDLVVQMKESDRRVPVVVSLRRIPGLRGISWDPASGLRVGAGTLLADVAGHEVVRERYAAIADGAGVVGSVQTRNLGTIGGNVCNAAPSADTAPGLLVYDAVAHIAGAGGARRLPLREFFTGPGTTALQAGEIVTAFELPVPPERSGSVYQRHTPRKAMDIAVVGVACRVDLDSSGSIADAAIALGAVAPTPIRCPEAEALLRGERPSEALFERAAVAARDASRPISDVRGSAEFRRELVRVMTKRCLAIAAARAANAAGAREDTR
jgi:carbon-monoxide dehydrogenase medium subunit